MTALVWDQVGERRYETGVDRGVLYPSTGVAVPWNGLISVNEIVSREVKPYYIDGIKFLDHHVPGSYAAKLSAFTYPDEMDGLIGTQEFSPGVFVHDQRSPKLFNLSYRTLVGNDIEGLDHAYKVHILYNLLAVPGDSTYTTNGESVEPQAFEWSIYGTPAQMFGIRPTSHISLDSRRIDTAMLETLEAQLYGTEDADPSLPSLVDLLGTVETV
jgi:hypothetical protein